MQDVSTSFSPTGATDSLIRLHVKNSQNVIGLHCSATLAQPVGSQLRPARASASHDCLAYRAYHGQHETRQAVVTASLLTSLFCTAAAAHRRVALARSPPVAHDSPEGPLDSKKVL